jgi:peptidoglycan hydrolase CwlO-like protein
VGLAVAGVWPFSGNPRSSGSYLHPTIWQLLLGDRITLGVVRLALFVIVLYVAASVPALAVAGRWMKGFGTSGVTADEAQDARKSLAELERKVRTLSSELDDATSQIDQLTAERNEARGVAVAIHKELKELEGAKTAAEK